MALNIQQIREKYPQYDKLSDEELASGFHKKFYSDMPYDEFKSKIGLTPTETTVAPEEPVKQQPSVSLPESSRANLSVLERMGLVPKGTTEQAGGYEQPVPFQDVARIAKGAIADPVVGLSQLAANVILDATGQEATKEQVNDLVRQYKEGVEKYTGKGLSFGEAFGAAISPLNKLAKLAQATTKGAMVLGTARAGAIQATAQPVTSDNFYADKAIQTTLGLVIGGVIPATAVGLGKIKDILSNVSLTSKARLEAARKHLNTLLGEDREAALNALRNPQEYVSGSRPTAAEALSEVPTASRLIAEQQRVSALPSVGSKTAPSEIFAQRQVEQEAARRAALTEISEPRGMTVKGLEEAREAATRGLREQGLRSANIYGETAPSIQAKLAKNERDLSVTMQAEGKMLTEEAQAIERANNWSPVPGMPQISGRYSPNMERALENKIGAREAKKAKETLKANIEFRKAQLKSLEDEGYYPLDVSGAVKQIDDILATPGYKKGKDEIVTSLKGIKEDLNLLADKNGFINSNDLYSVRQSIGEKIRTALGEKAAGKDKLIAGLESSVQRQIDKAINKAAGDTTWTDYLTKFAKYSKRIDRLKVGKALQNKLETALGLEQAGAFAEAVRNSRSLVAEATGIPRQASKVLTQREMNIINAVRQDLSRTAKAKDLASKIRQQEPEIASSAIPFVLEQKVTIFRSALNYIQRGNQAKVDQFFAELFAEPKNLALFIEAVPKTAMNDIVSSMLKVATPKMREAFIQRFSIGTAAEAAEGVNR